MNADTSTPTAHLAASPEPLEVDIEPGERERYPPSRYDSNLGRKASIDTAHAPAYFKRYRDHRSPSIASQDDSTYSTLGSRASPDRDFYVDTPHTDQDINFGDVDFGVKMDDDADTDWAPTPRGFDGDEEEPPEIEGSDIYVESKDETTPKVVEDYTLNDVEDETKEKGAVEEEMVPEIVLEMAPKEENEDEPTPKRTDYYESDPMVDISTEALEENNSRQSPEAKEEYIDWNPPSPSVFEPDAPKPTAREEDTGFIEWDTPTPAVFQDEITCDEEMPDVNVETSGIPSTPASTEKEAPEEPSLPEIPSITSWKLLEYPKDASQLEDAIINYVLTTIPVVFEEIIGYQLPVFVPGSGSSPRFSPRSGLNRTSSAFSQGSGSAYSSKRNTPQKKRKNEDDEDEDEDSRKRARRNGSPETATQVQKHERHYACLHYKESPTRYPDCQDKKWKREDIDLVASHIFTHLGPKCCLRCKARFRDEESAQEHAEQPKECDVRKEVDRPSANDIMVAEALEGELAAGSWSWLSLYQVVFPDSDFEPSPFHGDDSRKPRDISSRPVLSPVTLARRRTSNALPHSSPPPLSSRLTGSTLYGDESSASSENLQSTRQNSRDSTKTTLSDATLDNTDIVSPESTIPEHVRAEIQRILRNEPELLRQALQQPKATQSLFSCVKAGISTGFKKFLKDSKNPVKSDTRMWDVGPV